MINPKSIRPATTGQADFYSWQLFRWVRKHPDRTEVWESEGQLYIGWSDKLGDTQQLYGRRLNELCTAGKKLNSYGFCLPNGAKNVTKEFWAKYLEIGVCAIHGEFSHKWVLVGDSERKCEYCNKKETKHIRIKEVEVWI